LSLQSAAVDQKGKLILGDIQLELNILIFTLLINMGFLKITEVSTFISNTARTITSVGDHPTNLWPMILVSSAVVSYIVYVISIFLGVLQTFMKKDPKRAMCVSLIGFFAVYTCIFINAVSNA
jgi:hypothetical protein